MIKLNELTDKIKTILNGNEIASAKDMKIYFCISVLYTIMWFIFTNLPYKLYIAITSHLDIEIFAFILEFVIFIYLPEIIIFSLNYLISKMHFTKKTVKIIRISINIFCFIYFIILLLLIFFIYIISIAFDFGNSEYW